MVRKYEKKLGARSYRDYNEDIVESALQSVIDDGWSLRKASTFYKIPYGTLNNRYHGRHHRKNGGQNYLLLKYFMLCCYAFEVPM